MLFFVKSYTPGGGKLPNDNIKLYHADKIHLSLGLNISIWLMNDYVHVYVKGK